MTRRHLLWTLPFAAAVLVAGPSARAGTPDCASLPGTVVYLESGDTQENLLKVLGRQLRDSANITLAFELTGSCGITSDMYTGAQLISGATLDYIPSTAEDPTWDPTQPESNCTVDPAGAPIDLGIAALFVESCGLGDPPAATSLALVRGPVQAYTFVVPTASDEQAIWAEEAYYAFGFGNENRLAPWNDQELMFIRPPSKSTLVATAANIVVPAEPLARGAGERVDRRRCGGGVVATARAHHRHPGRRGLRRGPRRGDQDARLPCLPAAARVLPGLDLDVLRQANVRDGHYTLWSPTVYITPVDASGTPVNSAVAYLEDLVLGDDTATAPEGGMGIDGLADVVQVGLVPDCAMRVTRTVDGGPLSLYSPSAPCSASSRARSREPAARRRQVAPRARATRRAAAASAATASARGPEMSAGTLVALVLGAAVAGCSSSSGSPAASDASAAPHDAGSLRGRGSRLLHEPRDVPGDHQRVHRRTGRRQDRRSVAHEPAGRRTAATTMTRVTSVRTGALGVLLALAACSQSSATAAPASSSPSPASPASEHTHELHLPPAGPTVIVAFDGRSVDVSLASLSPDGGPVTLGQVWRAAWPSQDPASLRFNLVGVDGFRPMSRPKCTRLLTGIEMAAARIDVGSHDVAFDDALGLAGCYRVKATVRLEASRAAGKAFGEPCTADPECAGAVCFHKRIKGPDSGAEKRDAGSEPLEHDGYCSMSCNDDADCPVPPTRGRCGARGMCKRPE